MNVGGGQVRRVAGAGVVRPATEDVSGAPHVVPICPARDGGDLHAAVDHGPECAPAPGLRRVQNIKARPRFALVVDR